MLPKKRRVSKSDIDVIFKQGKFISSPLLTFKFISGGAGPARISFIAPKSVAKTSVKRNSLRRSGYSALGKYLNKFSSGVVGAFILRKIPKSTLETGEQIKYILEKTHNKTN